MFSFRSINFSNNELYPLYPIDNNISFPLYFNRIIKPKPVIPFSPIPVLTNQITPKLKWGEPIWNLFHVLAEKIIPEHFFSIRTELFDIIRNICYNLPCPDCANHARNYINSVNFNSITTPLHLKELFFNFHNTVNKRKNFPIFDRNQLDKRYESMNLRNTIIIFLKHFRNKHNSVRMMTDDFFRSKLSNKIEKWFVENINKFAL